MANTFVLPKTEKSIALARIDWNESHQAVLGNFYSNAAPISTNIIIEGDNTVPINGMLFRSSNTHVLYVKDTNEKGNPVYSGWTTDGIGSHIIDNISLYDSDTLEIGQLFKTIGSNARLYMKSSNAGAFVDIGTPPANSVSTTSLAGVINLGTIT